MTDAEGLDYTPSGNQHNSTRHCSKSESSHKGKTSVFSAVRSFFNNHHATVEKPGAIL